MSKLKSRFPAFSEILPVYAVSAVLIYGWALIRFAWRLPSWLHYLTLGDLFGIFSYAMLMSLVESLFFIGLLLLVSALLPGSLFKDVFVLRGSAFSLIALGAILVYLVMFERIGPEFIEYIKPWSIASLLLAPAFAWLCGRIRFLGAAVTWLADRLTVFLFLLMPLSAAGAIVVILRNIF